MWNALYFTDILSSAAHPTKARIHDSHRYLALLQRKCEKCSLNELHSRKRELTQPSIFFPTLLHTNFQSEETSRQRLSSSPSNNPWPHSPFYHLEIDLKSLVCIFKKIKTKTGTKTEYFPLQLIFSLHQIIASLIAIYIWYIFALWAQSWQISLSGHQMLKCRFMPESPSFQGYLRLVGN